VGELGRRLINDTELRERLETIPCPFGGGRATEPITRGATLPALTKLVTANAALQ
jgi:hypothetical protein